IVLAQARQLMPRFAAIGRAEQRCVFDSGVNGVGIAQRWFEMPHSLELPRMLRAVVPLVSAGNTVVDELITFGLWHSVSSGCRLAGRCTRLHPRLAAIIRALDDLPKPRAALRRIQPVRINRRTFDVVNLPTRKVRATNIPSFALAVRCQHECALPCANQYSYFTHSLFLR